MVDREIQALVAYALDTGLIEPCEQVWAVNALLETLELDSYTEPETPAERPVDLPAVLTALMNDAHARGVLKEDSVVYRDLFDTKLMGVLTPRPAQVIGRFRSLYAESPEKATDWYYKFSQDTNYIRRDRIARDVKWIAPTEYGDLDITINLSKPEKDPKAIAAARNLPASAYPRCQLCAENEGYAGRVNHPARENHRIVPITINGSPWFLQYSPYVYYNEHCICLNSEHVPMKIDRACFGKLLDFVGQFPHYFVGSNADLPIVGGSILAHDHFQGGHYTFAMEKAPVETPVTFPGYEDVKAGIVKWPMSVVRLTAADPERLIDLADKILLSWRGYTDADAFIEQQKARHVPQSGENARHQAYFDGRIGDKGKAYTGHKGKGRVGKSRADKSKNVHHSSQTPRSIMVRESPMAIQTISTLACTARAMPMRAWPSRMSCMALMRGMPGMRKRTLTPSAVCGVEPSCQMTAGAAIREAVKDEIMKMTLWLRPKAVSFWRT